MRRHGWILHGAEVGIVQVDIALKTLHVIAIALVGNNFEDLRFHRIQRYGLLADHLVDVVTAVGIGNQFGHFAGLQVHDRLMVRRQRGAAEFLHLCGRRSSRESSGGVCLFFQLVGVFPLNGARAEIGGDFLHRFFSSLLLRLGWSWIGRRRAFPTGLGIGLGLCGRRYDLLGAGNVNPRQGGLLVGGFVLLVIVFEIGVANLSGIILQRAAE